MPRFYFDTSDDERLIVDEDGIELSGVQAARDEATRALADLAKDILPRATRREIAVIVKDEAGKRLLRAALAFELEQLT
jgi:hypothetical protein